jgi:hypothetical protein
MNFGKGGKAGKGTSSQGIKFQKEEDDERTALLKKRRNRGVLPAVRESGSTESAVAFGVSSSLGPAAGARNGSEPTSLARSSFSIIHDLSRMIYRFKKDGTLELAGPAGVSALPALSSLLLFSSFLLSPFSSALSP